MNKFKKFAMITDYDLNIFDYQGIKHAQNTVCGHVFFSLSTKTPKEPIIITISKTTQQMP